MTPFIGRARPQLRPPETNHHNTKGDTAMISARDEQLALAQQQVFRSRRKYLRAKARLERDIRRRDQLCPVARAHKATKNIYDAVQALTEQPAPEPSPTLDCDPRSPADQAHEFFTRPGDFYQVALALSAPTNGAKLGAGFIVKADDTQLPYLLEVLRQLRGALGEGTRVELTKAQITPPDGPPKTIGVDYTLSDRFPPAPAGTIENHVSDIIDTYTSEEPSLEDKIATTAEQFGVDPSRIRPIPIRGGGTAFTVQPEPQPERGRHARPDDDWETTPRAHGLGDHHDDSGDDDEALRVANFRPAPDDHPDW
ncbi:hypothetical protein [Mycobacteroides abscessus]|uniref:hypothetical protein n=1 Tax=Mycobacteroides abscessus TaxID=36809 RepID=UPI0039A07C8A